VPSDDWTKPAPPLALRNIATEFEPDGDAIVRLAAAIGAAKRPAFVVGPEVDRSGAVGRMVVLVERSGALVWASPMSSRCSFPERHPRFAGFLQAMPVALDQALRDADLVVVFGAPIFTFHVEGPCGLLSGDMPIWHVTDDPLEAASAAVGVSVVGTISKAVAALLDVVPARSDMPPASSRRTPFDPIAATPIPVEYALSQLSALLPNDAIVVEEAPSHRPLIQRYLPRPGADSFYTMASGGLGHGLPASVGIALAKPGRRIACVIGDGSAMYAIQAIWTAAQRKLPITFIVLNNAGYGAMRSFSRLLKADRPPGIDLPGIDFVSLVRGLGCPATRVATSVELSPALRAALATDGPFLVDIVLGSGTAELFDV
jgi:benzoylformate decarboxylase